MNNCLLHLQGTEVVGVTSTVSVTETYKTISKECTRVTTEVIKKKGK